MEAFITGEDIELKEFLFGRDKVIDRLASFARRHEIAGLVAPRRFGKTCMLKTMVTVLRECNEDAYPVYFSAHDYSVRNNTDEVFCRLATAVATRMCIDGIIPEGEYNLFRKTPVYISTDPIDNYEAFSELTPERQRESLFKLAEKLRTDDSPHKYLLLLLDEVDYLLLTAFESPDDFMRIREAATQKQAVVKFWIAGPASWKHMCTSIGSPGLNCGLENVPLRPLEYSDFKKMWEYECSLIKDPKTIETSLNILDYAYDKSGGVPFYAKFIGRQYQLDQELQEKPSFIILRDYLDEMYHNRFFTDAEREVMNDLSKGPINYGESEPEGVSLVIDKGVAKKKGNHTMLSIGFLSDYIRSFSTTLQTGVLEMVEDTNQQIINESVDEINALIQSINETFLNKQQKQVFETPMSALDDDRRLRSICNSKDEFGDYLSVVYTMYYERSKTIRINTGTLQPGQRLHEVDYLSSSSPQNLSTSPDYYRNRDFFKILEPLRASYDAHIPEKLGRQIRLGQLSVGDALEQLKGNRNSPEPDEWVTLQIKILALFIVELKAIKRKVLSL